MKNIIAAALVALCCNVLAGDLPDLGEPSLGRYELSEGQAIAETAFVGLMYIDYRQTMDIITWCDRDQAWLTASDGSIITRQPDGRLVSSNGASCHRYEPNPLLGPNPSPVKVRNYFIGMTLAHVAIAKALPNEYRPYWIGGWIAIQLYTVVRNKQLGLSVNF